MNKTISKNHVHLIGQISLAVLILKVMIRRRIFLNDEITIVMTAFGLKVGNIGEVIYEC